MAKYYEIHVADGRHFKENGDPESNTHISFECVDGRWVEADGPTPIPSEMVEQGPGNGPQHCPVCGDDAIASTYPDE